MSKVRSSVAYAVSAIAHWDWPEAWPQLFNLLMEMLVSGDLNAVHGAMRVLTGEGPSWCGPCSRAGPSPRLCRAPVVGSEQRALAVWLLLCCGSSCPSVSIGKSVGVESAAQASRPRPGCSGWLST